MRASVFIVPSAGSEPMTSGLDQQRSYPEVDARGSNPTEALKK